MSNLIKDKLTAANKPAARNAGGFWRQALTKPDNDNQ